MPALRRQTGCGEPFLIKELLPLPDHAQVAVIHHGDLDGDIVLHQGGQLLDGHLETAVTIDAPDRFIGTAHLGAHGRRQTEAHRAQPAGGNEVVRLVEGVMLGGPHLVLAHPGDDHRLAAGGFIQFPDDILRQQ